MVPDKFNMVDMGGIDLIMMQGEEVPGLYDRLVESIAQCRYQCLYNWLFDGVVIPPTYVDMEVNEDDEVEINEGVTVSPDDVIHIYSVEPSPTEIIPLLAEENGTYNVPSGVDGFNPVTVNVPSYTPVIQSLSVTENGTYTPSANVDGFAPVSVNVSSGVPDIDYSYLPNSLSANVLMSEDWQKYENSSVLGRIIPSIQFQDGSLNLNGIGLCQDLESADSSVTCYLACKGTSGANGFPLSVPYSHSSNNCPLFYFSGTSVKYANYGGDITVSGISSTDYHVYAIAVDSVNHKSRFFIDGAFIGEKTGLSHSGNRVSIAKDKLISSYACSIYFKYGGVVSQFESDSDIIANMQTITQKLNL